MRCVSLLTQTPPDIIYARRQAANMVLSSTTLYNTRCIALFVLIILYTSLTIAETIDPNGASLFTHLQPRRWTRSSPHRESPAAQAIL